MLVVHYQGQDKNLVRISCRFFFFGKGVPLIRQINDKEIVPSAAEDNYQKPKHAEMRLKLLPTSLKIVQILFMSYTHVYKTLML